MSHDSGFRQQSFVSVTRFVLATTHDSFLLVLYNYSLSAVVTTIDSRQDGGLRV